MTVLTVIQAVCKKIGLDVPSAVYGSTEREHIELAEMANEVAERIVEHHDWKRLAVLHKYVGDGTAEKFDLPADYDRMISNGKVWNSRTNNPVSALSLEDWHSRQVRGFDVYSAYIIIDGKMCIQPVMAVGEETSFFYTKRTCVTGVVNGVSVGSHCFTADDDEFALPERLLRLGIIWQWRESKGLAYAEDMQNYEIALAKEVKSDGGTRMIKIGGSRLRGYKVGYPRTIT